MARTSRCEACYHYEHVSSECRVEAPKMLQFRDEKGVDRHVTASPKVAKDHFCGQYIPHDGDKPHAG